MFDAPTVGLFCALAFTGGALWAFWHTGHYANPTLPASEVERRTRPWVPGKRRDAPAPTNPVDVE